MDPFDLHQYGITVDHVLRNPAPAKLYEEAIRIEDLGSLEGPEETDSSMDLGLLSILCAPLFITLQDRPDVAAEKRRHPPQKRAIVLGALYVDDTRIDHQFEDEAFTVFKTLASFASTALLNVHLFRELTIDPETELVNHNEVINTLHSEILRGAQCACKPE